ncbi:MAG: TolC family protein [Terriglobales bacterium]
MNSSRFRTIAALLAFLAAPLGAQSLLHFHLQTPQVRSIEGLAQRIHNGELHLTLRDFLQLVLANDTEVQLLQLNDSTARFGVISAQSPFDPSLTASFAPTRSVTPQATQISGASTLSSLSQRSSVGYTQVLPSGQSVTAAFDTNRSSSNAAFNTFNPSLSSGVTFSFTQDLLQNRGGLQYTAPLQIAKIQVLVVGDQTRASLATDINNAAVQYWTTVQARDQITVQQDALKLAQSSYDLNRHMLDLGALAPGGIYTSQAQVAQDQTAVLQAQSNYEQQLDQLRRLIGADLDPAAEHATIILDDDPSAVTPTAPSMSVNAAIQAALLHRPELDAIHRQLLESKTSLAMDRDALRPQLNLTGTYGSNGLAGDQVATVTPLGSVVGGSSSGFGNALGQVFGFGSPTYGFSLNLTLPLRNSRVEAQMANDLTTQTSYALNARNEEQQIRQDVRLADTQVRMAVAEIKSAVTARDLSQKNVDYEQQEYLLGATTEFELLQAQVQLSQAQSSVLSAFTSYQEARIAYERAIWTLLPSMGLKLQQP